MKKRSLFTMLAALCLVGVIMVGATLAYLTDKTDDVVNTFTVGNVDIDLTEPNWDPDDAKDLEPGAEVAKDPTVTNNKNDAYVAVTVDGMTEMAAAGFSATVNENWVLVDADGVPVANWDGSLVDGIYAYTKSALTKGESTNPLFDFVKFEDNGTFSTTYVIDEVANDPADEAAGTHFEVNGKSFDTEAEARAYVASLEEILTTTFDLVLKAYAIQTTGFDIVTNGAYTWVAEFGL